MNKKYICNFEGCTSSFPRPSKLAIHMLLHEGKIPFPCHFEGCNKGYSTKAHLKRHTFTHSSNITNKILCSVEGCRKEFANTSNLQRHMKKAHNPDRVYNYKCKECDQSFTKKKLLHQHTFLHTGEYAYSCDICNKGFHLLSDLNRHRRIHSFYTCAQCKSNFTAWSLLCKHKITHKPIFKCKVCGYKTYIKQNLKIHEDTHTPRERRKLFQCQHENCSRSYLHVRNLVAHEKVVHKGCKAKKISCIVEGCSAKLSKMAALKYHIKVIHERVPKSIKRPRLVRKDAGTSRTDEIKRLCASFCKNDEGETIPTTC